MSANQLDIPKPQVDIKIQQKPAVFRFWFPPGLELMRDIYYYIILAFMFPITYIPFVIRYQATHTVTYLQDSYLTPYLFGLKRDAHDPQWQAFRSNYFVTIGFMIFWKITNCPLKYSYIIGLILALYAYRGDIFIYGSFLIAWYFWTKLLHHKRFFVPICWVMCILLLYFNQLSDHMRFISNWMQEYIPEQLSFLRNDRRQILWAHLLNMNLLKLLSFSIDYHRGDESQKLKQHLKKCTQCKNQQNLVYCQKARDLFPLVPMNFLNFLNYILFVPTLTAGPPISYKAFHSFTMIKTTVKPRYINWILLVLCFELFQHIFPSFPPTPEESLLVNHISSLMSLMFIWFKFLVIWRTGRLFAAIAGVDVIDNLQRCVCNNYGFEGFWRVWHRGFNHWLIRYLYIPLGGNNNYFSVIAVIAFVAFWHDHTIKIVLWAMIIVVFMVPELAIKRWFRIHKQYHKYCKNFLFLGFCALLCGCYIQIMALANLIAFGYGHNNAMVFIEECKRNWVQLFLIIFHLGLMSIVMFKWRDNENGAKNF